MRIDQQVSGVYIVSFFFPFGSLERINKKKKKRERGFVVVCGFLGGERVGEVLCFRLACFVSPAQACDAVLYEYSSVAAMLPESILDWGFLLREACLESPPTS